MSQQPTWIHLLSLALSLAPTVGEEISEALTTHWGSDPVNQIAQGAAILEHVAATVKTATDVATADH